jgi:hypothetical protein
VSPKEGFDAVEERKFFTLHSLELRLLGFYTDCVIRAPLLRFIGSEISWCGNLILCSRIGAVLCTANHVRRPLFPPCISPRALPGGWHSAIRGGATPLRQE